MAQYQQCFAMPNISRPEDLYSLSLRDVPIAQQIEWGLRDRACQVSTGFRALLDAARISANKDWLQNHQDLVVRAELWKTNSEIAARKVLANN